MPDQVFKFFAWLSCQTCKTKSAVFLYFRYTLFLKDPFFVYICILFTVMSVKFLFENC